MSTLKVDQILKRSGTGTITLGQSGDTISVPTGASLSLQGGSNGQALTTNGSGTLSFATVGGDNKPILSVGLSSPQTLTSNTWSTIIFNTEILDASAIYNNSTGVATPTSGTYLMIFAANIGGGGNSSLLSAGVKFLVGGSVVTAEQTANARSNNQNYVNLVTSYIQTFDGSTSVVCQAYNEVSTGTPSVYGGSSPRFGATFQMVKLIS